MNIPIYFSTTKAHQDPFKERKKKKKEGKKKGLKCTGDLLLSTATRYIDLENVASHLDFGFRDTLFYNSVVHRFKSSFRKKINKIFILETIQLPPTSCSHVSAMIFMCRLSKQVTVMSILN